MTEYSPVKWVEEVVKGCLDYISGREVDKDLGKLKCLYDAYSDMQKNKVHLLILKQFEGKDIVFILSYIIKILKIDDFQEDVARQMCVETYPWNDSIMLEMQLNKISYDMKMIIHKKNIDLLQKNIKIDLAYINLKDRNFGKIVIITEQLLITNLKHAPTRMVLEIAYVLKKYFSYEVEIYTCAGNRNLPVHFWIETFGYNTGQYGVIDVKHKDTEIKVHQYPLAECNENDYRNMMLKIHKTNPYFVLNIGVNSPIADLPHQFTTVVNLNTVIEPPVSEADIFVRLTKLKIRLEDIYSQSLAPYQKQIFMERNFPAIFDITGRVYTRKEIKLPEEKFLIAVVGNRLDTELSEEFIQLMVAVLTTNEKIDFVIIGNVDNIKKYLDKTEIRNRIHYMGFCSDLYGIYHTLDLYLNPERLGGGWSSAIALCAGIPVITLPDCDVAYNVSKIFTVNSYQEMFQTVLRYVDDSGFYKLQKQNTQMFADQNGEQGVIEFLKDMLKKISEEMIY